MTTATGIFSTLLNFTRSRLTCAQRLNCVAAWWFWLTIIGVFYCGLGIVLPDLYENQLVLLCHHIFVYFMFIQMMINWLCVRLISSPYRAEEHKDPVYSCAELVAQGYEINLNHLKERPKTPNSYVMPTSSLYNSIDVPGHAESEAPVYLVALLGTPNDLTGENGRNGRTATRHLVYPYWSWKPCVICQCQRPPRAHHCTLCRMCVLKRDHHCFFTGSCVGLRNQRHFIVFNFWATVATSYCLIHSFIYIFYILLLRCSFWDLLLPITWIRWMLKWTSGTDTIMITILYSVAWFWLTTLGFLLEQSKLIRNGSTSFEEDHQIKIANSQSLDERIRSVFGDHWMLNFIVPLHFFYPTPDNGVSWPNIKV